MTAYHTKATSGPVCAKINPNKIAVLNSTNGYCREIFERHLRHFPPSNTHDTIGTKSYQRNLYPHDIQPDRPFTPRPVPYRKITTLRKLPIMAPKITAADIKNNSMPIVYQTNDYAPHR